MKSIELSEADYQALVESAGKIKEHVIYARMEPEDPCGKRLSDNITRLLENGTIIDYSDADEVEARR